MNNSPWIEQLKKRRPVQRLQSSTETEIAIVGAGIAGVSTAYFVLKNTPHKVLLIEASLAAHGATGHNAGQIVSYFERQISELVKDYGLELTAQAQESIDGAWDLIDDIYTDTKIPTPLYQFHGYAGCQDREEVLIHLENILTARQANLNVEPMALADDVASLSEIPKKYDGIYSRMPQDEVLRLLESNDRRFIAVVQARKGCMNSALFCEDMLDHLLATYADRFKIVEESPVEEVVLEENKATLKIGPHEVLAQRVVLCTNGFEKFTITNLAGKDIDKRFHHLVNGRAGFMAAYVSPDGLPPIAVSYLNSRQAVTGKKDGEPYFYLTRRPYENASQPGVNLVCVGGPETAMDDSNNYKREHPYPEEAQRMIDTFLHRTYKHAPSGTIEYAYTWHGLMGYTPSGLRCIGPEPRNPLLLYNLGCNGVGILPSIYGGKKIAQFLNNENLPSSLFDPKLSQAESTSWLKRIWKNWQDL